MFEMPAAPAAATASPLLGQPSGAIAFRITGSGQSGRVVRLTGPKCKLGSAPDCSLRIRAEGVSPVHCLLLRGPGGVVARAWAPQTFLNGHPLSSARLRDGDLLRLGPVELEFIDENQRFTPPAPTTAPNPVPSTREIVKEVTRRVKADWARRQWRNAAKKKIRLGRKQIAELKRRLRGARQQAAEQERETDRLEREIERLQLRLSHAALQVAPAPVIQPVRTPVSDEVHPSVAAIENLQRAHSDERLTWETSRQELERQLATRHDELERCRNSLAAAEQAYFEAEQTCQERQQAYEASEAACRELRLQMARQSGDHDQLHQAFEAKLEELAKLSLELSAARESYATAESRYQASQQEFLASETARSELASEVERLTQLVEMLRQEQESRAAAIAEECASAEPLVSDVVVYDDEVSQVAEQVQSIAGLVEPHADPIAQLAEHIAQLAERDGKITRLQHELAELQTSYATTQAALTAEEQRSHDLRSSLETHELAIYDREQVIASLRKGLIAAEERTQALLAELAGHDARIVSLTETIATQQAAYRQQQADLLEWDAKVSQLYLERDELQQTLSQLRHDYETSLVASSEQPTNDPAQLEQLQDELLLRNGQLDQVRREVLELQDQLATRQREQTRDQNAAQSRIGTLELQLQQQIDAAQASLAGQEQLRSEEQQRFAEERTQAEQEWSLELRTLQQQLHSHEAAHGDLQQQLEELQSRLEEAQAEVRGRDAHLLQIRDEVTQQFAAWNTERTGYLAELEQLRSQLAQASSHPPEETRGPAAATLVEPEPMPEDEIVQQVHAQADSETFSAVMAKLGQAGLMRDAALPEPVADSPPDAPSVMMTQAVPVLSHEARGRKNADDAFATLKANLLAEAAEAKKAEAAAATALAAQASPVTPPATSATASEPATSSPDHERDSIEEYMSRLLKRVRGDSATYPLHQSASPAVSAPPVVMENPHSEEQVVAPLLDDEEYTPRGAAPEKNVDISALRNIAVSSAREAIDLSAVRSHRNTALMIMVGVFCGTVAGSVLLCYAIKTGTLWAAYTAFPCFAMGLYGMIQRVKLLRQTWKK